MNFLEKHLETIIWENYEACEARGLRLNNELFRYGQRFRQMNLMPFGIADLVNVFFDPVTSVCHIQVIECKREKITSATYIQAKRYVAALEEVIMNSGVYTPNDLNITTEVSIYLIGATIDTNSELAHTIAMDRACRSYVYQYEADGIKFRDCSNYWWLDHSPFMSKGQTIPDHNGLERYIRDKAAQYERYKISEGDLTKPLLITKDGVLFNPLNDAL